MILVGLALIAVGIADLCAGGLGGEIANARRAAAATIIALVVAAIGLCATSSAAALIISAKSILRFPEISRTAQSHDGHSHQAETSKSESSAQPPAVDAVTEYFLLGSLSSWMLALAPIILLRD